MNNDEGKREQIFNKQRTDILKSPLVKTDREILIKIAKYSLHKGYCYQFQKVLALEILNSLDRGSVSTLQKHFYRLRDTKILRIKVNAGENGENHYQIDWDVLNGLPANFELPPFRKNDTPEAKQERLAKQRITLRASEPFMTALAEMAAACGLTGAKAVEHFVCELMEVAIVEAYEKRFNKTISGSLLPTEVVEPEPEAEENR